MMQRKVLLSLTALGSLLGLRPASAAEKEECIQAYVQAQKLKAEGKLLFAQTQLRACSDASCPDLLRQECTQWSRGCGPSLRRAAGHVFGWIKRSGIARLHRRTTCDAGSSHSA